jgi:hypothetical protein
LIIKDFGKINSPFWRFEPEEVEDFLIIKIRKQKSKMRTTIPETSRHLPLVVSARIALIEEACRHNRVARGHRDSHNRPTCLGKRDIAMAPDESPSEPENH